MRVDIDISGLKALTAQLQKVSKGGPQVVADVINELAFDTQSEAVKGIQQGPASGRTYTRGSITHTASAPGEYPMSDTGRLSASVDIQLATAQRLTGKVGTGVAYGPMLEFGTSRMASRPWLLPSFEKAKVKTAKRLKRRIEALL